MMSFENIESPKRSMKIRGEILKQVYRVWLFRKFLPVLVIEVLVLAVIFYQFGRLVFIQKIIENALSAFFINPPNVVSFFVSAFVEASLTKKLLGFAVLVLLALVIRHITQGILRLILVRENYFGRIQKTQIS